jgi:hypothetical protein
VTEKQSLGLKVPARNFSIGDVATLVGGTRTVPVMSVSLDWMLREWRFPFKRVYRVRRHLENSSFASLSSRRRLESEPLYER